jgi:hypothetical protein
VKQREGLAGWQPGWPYSFYKAALVEVIQHLGSHPLDQAPMTRDVNWVLDIDIRSFHRGGGAGHERQGGDWTSIRRG